MTKRFRRLLQRGAVVAIATTVITVSPAYADLNVSPESIIVTGVRNEQASITLTFSNSEGATTLQAAVSDLRTIDGGGSIAADKIEITPPKITIPANAPAQMRLAVDLAEASASGEFSGSLYLYHPDGRQVVPLIVRIKAASLRPWIIMIAGVLLGTGLSLYRAEGRSRDEIIVQVGRLRNQMRSDSDLDEDFQTSIESELVDVESAVEDKDWETAKAQVLEAKALWTRWRKGREDWIAQLQDGKNLISENFDNLGGLVKSTVYMQGVKDRIDTTRRKLRTGQYETPQALKDEFSEIRRLLSQFKEGEALLTYLQDLRSEAQLPKDREQYWLDRLELREKDLHNLGMDTQSFQDWKTKLEHDRDELKEEIAQLTSDDATQEGTGGIMGRSAKSALILPDPLLSGPSVVSQFNPNQVAQAGRNLRWFNWISQAIAIALLSWLGMTELYGNNPIFGADPLRDYFSLLAWGFGAELTRESVVRATQDLGLPLTK
ncbi:hypothetical protein NDI52_07205 [Leptolyngbya sp. PL-A3]|uniref:hypothetical protein n=1 Tax=Leptolyngbya sp. PL-A3 TaxID=2933911 RepID=UPI00329904A8